MANGKQIRRAYWTYKCIKEGGFPNKNDILAYIRSKDLNPSLKTVERDIDYLRNSLLMDIQYDQKEVGYYFDKEGLSKAAGAMRFLELAYLAENIDRHNHSKHISYGEADLLDGLENIPILLEAIDKKRIVTFQHESYNYNTISDRSIEPYLLREYMNRWYVIGYKTDTRELRTYGIDRISELQMTEETFERKSNHNIQSLFDQVIGVVFDASKILKIEFKAPLSQKKYLQSLPLHASQCHLIDFEGECYFQIEVVHNYELEQKLLMHSPFVTVTKPNDFAEYFGNKLKEIANRY